MNISVSVTKDDGTNVSQGFSLIGDAQAFLASFKAQVETIDAEVVKDVEPVIEKAESEISQAETKIEDAVETKENIVSSEKPETETATGVPAV